MDCQIRRLKDQNDSISEERFALIREREDLLLEKDKERDKLLNELDRQKEMFLKD